MTRRRRDTIHDLLWRAMTALYDGDAIALQAACEDANNEAICALDEMPVRAGGECEMEMARR